MIPPEITALMPEVRQVLAEHGPLTTVGLAVYLPDRQPEDIAAAVHALKRSDRIRRCARRENRTMWALADRPTAVPPVRLSPVSSRVHYDHDEVDVMAEAVPADGYAYTSKRQRMRAEQYGVERIYCHQYGGGGLPNYIGRQMAAAGWRAVRLGVSDTGNKCIVWGMIRTRPVTDDY